MMLGLLFGCSKTAEVGSDEIENYSAKQIFDRAEFEMARSKLIDAISFFSDVERLYPYSEWAKRSVIMQAFANHKANQYEEARDAAERYIEYYKWIDDSLGQMIMDLFPASAIKQESIRTMVESHILERNKYWNKN